VEAILTERSTLFETTLAWLQILSFRDFRHSYLSVNRVSVDEHKCDLLDFPMFSALFALSKIAWQA
jgi:hypothetical protein